VQGNFQGLGHFQNKRPSQNNEPLRPKAHCFGDALTQGCYIVKIWCMFYLFLNLDTWHISIEYPPSITIKKSENFEKKSVCLYGHFTFQNACLSYWNTFAHKAPSIGTATKMQSVKTCSATSLLLSVNLLIDCVYNKEDGFFVNLWCYEHIIHLHE
jgi:hypothetical protein